MAQTTVGDVVSAMVGTIRSRHEAADLLRAVADDGEAGHYPDDVQAEQFGRACVRLLVNCNEPDAFGAFLRGFAAARARYEG